MTARDFHNVYRELIDENPLAIRAVLKVLCVEFTDTVPTLAVTCEPQPRIREPGVRARRPLGRLTQLGVRQFFVWQFDDRRLPGQCDRTAH